ncbi:MAG: YHS domain-containing (seleno)protein [Bacteroidota bacterium]
MNLIFNSFILFILPTCSLLHVETALKSPDNSNRSENADQNKYCLYEGKGVDGYDLVTFFEEDPLKGNEKFKSSYDGVSYLFKNKINKDKFDQNPKKYLPKYGGWCATNMASKQLTKPRLDLYIVNEKGLFLFERTLGVNGKILWSNNEVEYEKLANHNYNYLIEKGKFPD